MSLLSEVYGKNYKQNAKQSIINQHLDVIASNISNRELNFKIPFDSKDLWENGHFKYIETMFELIQRNNSKLICMIISNENINIIPILILNKQVDYFLIVDIEFSHIYFLYITPNEVGCF